MVPDGKLIDSAPHGIDLATILREARSYDLAVLHTSSPSFGSDVRALEALKAVNPRLKAGFVGAKVAVEPDASLKASPSIDFVAGNEFDFTIKEIAEGRDWPHIRGLSYRDRDGAIRHNEPREILEDMDQLPFVCPVYRRDLTIEKYFIGYLLHPYISLYTGRGCPAKCTFCLWPQTIGGHTYRAKSPSAVIREMELGKALFGRRVREWMFDDDTFTIDRARAIEIAKGMKKLKLTWSCNARANLDYETLRQLRD